MDADHEGIKSGVHFPIGFEHMVNYYGYLKGGNNYSNYREWAIKRLLGDKQYQVLVDSKCREEIVKVDLYQNAISYTMIYLDTDSILYIVHIA